MNGANAQAGKKQFRKRLVESMQITHGLSMK